MSDARKMVPERWYQNPGSCSWWSKNELHVHTGSKQVQFLLKASRQLPGLLGGGRRAPFLYCPLGIFLFLKVGGGTNVGSRDMWFSSTGLAQLPISVLVQ